MKFFTPTRKALPFIYLVGLFFVQSGIMAQDINLAQAGLIEESAGATPNVTRAYYAAVSGNYAYVVGATDALEILDITLPGLPRHVGLLSNGEGGALISNPRAIAVSGNFAYIANLNGQSVEIVDVSDPTSPKHDLTLTPASGANLLSPMSIFVLGNYIYVANLNGALDIFDISNPLNRTFMGSILGSATVKLAGARSVFVSNVKGQLYAFVGASNDNALEVINVTDPKIPKHVASLVDATIFQGSLSNSLYVDGNNLFVASVGGNSLTKIRISDPTKPNVVGTVVNPSGATNATYPAFRPWSCVVSGPRVFAVGESGGLLVADTTTLAVQSGQIFPELYGSGIAARSITVQGGYAYIPNQYKSSFVVVDVSNPQVTPPTVKSVVTTGKGGVVLDAPVSIAVSNDIGYVSNRNVRALQLINVKNPTAPVGISTFTNLNGNPVGVVVRGNYAYVITNGASLEIVDITNPLVPVLAGRLVQNPTTFLPYLDGANTIALASISNNLYAVIANRYNGVNGNHDALEIINVTDPKNPVHTAAVLNNATSGNSYAPPYLIGPTHVAVFRSFAYVISNGVYGSKQGALEIIDLAKAIANQASHAGGLRGVGSNLWFSSYEGGGNNIAVGIRSDSSKYAYIGDAYFSRLKLVNVTNPATIPAPDSIDIDPVNKVWPRGINVVGNAVVVTYNYFGDGGMQVIDATNPHTLVRAGSLFNRGGGALLSQPTSSVVSGNYCYITNIGVQAVTVVDLYAPVITSFTPTTGVAGTPVTFTGKNFGTLIKPSINGVPTPVVTVAGKAMTVTVPAVGIGRFKLKLFNQVLTTATNFLVIPTPKAATSISTSGFTAGWSDVGATTYFLDVSTDNFATFVPGYKALNVGNVTTYNVSGLAPNTAYQYQIRSSDGKTNSGNTTPVTAITLPGAPVLAATTAINQTGFTINWAPVVGITSYYLDVATDVNFKLMLGNYNNLLVSGTSRVVSGLGSGTTYYYRVSAANASGSSAPSTPATATTIPASPTALSATSVTTAGFNANWSPVNGASEYFLDVSTDNFITLLPGYSNVSVGQNTSYAVNANPATTYQFRVRAANASGLSFDSNVVSVLTLTPVPAAQPTNITFANATANAVTVSYSAASASVDGYLVLRSTTPTVSTPVIATPYAIGSTIGSSVVAYVGPSLSFFDVGLTNSTTYFYAVFSYNGAGASVNYLTTSPLQGSVTMDVTPPVISMPVAPNPSTVNFGNTPNLNVTIVDNVKVSSALIYYRGISKPAYRSAPLEPSGTSNNYTVQVQTDWYDSLGMEYYFWAVDENANATESPAITSFLHLVTPSITLPPLPAGDKMSDYRIVAFPYVLPTDNKVTTVYNGVPWNDNTKAAIWWWNPNQKSGAGDYDQYKEGNSSPIQSIEVGKGYWVITSSAFSPSLTNVPAPKYNRSNLFALTLKPKWNQVGNPYPFPISWDDVIALNPNAPITALAVYDAAGFASATGSRLLKPFEGGFVRNLSSSDVTIYIPFKGQSLPGGRTANVQADGAWNVNLNIGQGSRINRLGGFGMHPMATTDVDRFDNFNPPRFNEDPELRFSNSSHPDDVFSKEIVAVSDEYVWKFVADGKAGSVTTLTWDLDQTLSLSKDVLLLDEQTLEIIDMKSAGSYAFTASGNDRFKIYYGADVRDAIATEGISASSVFPNPLSVGHTGTIHVGLPPAADTYEVVLEVYNMQGQLSYVVEKRLAAGIHAVSVNFTDHPTGLYLYKLRVHSQTTSRQFNGKLIKP